MKIDTNPKDQNLINKILLSGKSSDSSNCVSKLHQKQNHKQYSILTKKTLHLMDNETRVAIGLSEWLQIRNKYESIESKWLNVTIPLCFSLLFSFICLLGTVTFQVNGKIKWLPLLAGVIHAAGFIIFGLLSIYFWQKNRKLEENPSYKLVKAKLDYLFDL